MNIKITLSFIVFISAISIAQTKLGTVDSDYIISVMPETKVVQEMTQKYSAKLDSSFTIKVEDFKIRLADYKTKQKEMGPLEKKTFETELSNLETDIKKYQKNGNALMGLKKDELMRPLYRKLNVAITKISKADKYTQILTTSGNQFAFIDPDFDITNLVIKELGITTQEPNK